MIVSMSLTRSSSGLAGRPTRLRGLARAGWRLTAMFERETPSAAQTAFIGYRPWAQRARATDVFLAARDVQRLLQDLGFHRLLAQQPLGVAQLVLQGAIVGRRNDLLFSPRRRQRALGRQTSPAEHLARRHAMPARHQADRDARFVRLRH